ncbi:MAG: DUF4476 domain-containing protein [Chitinophagaceae bacterium]|nr:DUF4476 domain-containing protein [Chitinophagaceae bacterium]
MKHSLSLLAFVFLTISLLAQNNSNLTISTTGTSNLRIKLSGKKYTLQDRNVTFQSLTPGTYTLSIYQLQSRGVGQGSDYMTIYDKTITLVAGRHLEVCVLRFGKVATDERPIEKDDWNENYRNPDPDREWGRGNGNNRYDNNRPVNETDFARIKSAIAAEYYDDDKLTMAKVVLKENWFTADQIKQLTNVFFYDDKKLAFAKYAYDFCTDKGNYYTVAQALYYDNNKKELLNYIAGR